MLQGYRREGDIQDEVDQLSAEVQTIDDDLSFFVHGAAGEKINGNYKGINEPFTNGNAELKRIDFGIDCADYCPGITLVWRMGYGNHGMYFSCQNPDSEIPPTEGWRPRNQRGWDWSASYAKKRSPSIAQRIVVVSGAGDETVNGDFFDIDDG